ncbi:tRNA-binding protein [Phenylobacterium sp.]|uniref:tRNA-binding protein n=1 Tax=Phenylobacterium sp. TaxID=1871053 RepID=UPI0035B319AE
MSKAPADFSSFAALDIRVGAIVSAVPADTRSPTLRMQIDFGPEIGVKVSCGAYTSYDPAALPGKLVLAVVNFPPRRMGPEVSEVLVLGVPNPAGPGAVFLTVDRQAPNGAEVF